MLFKDCGRTDGHTDDDDDRRWVITKAHLEPSAQVSQKIIEARALKLDEQIGSDE